MRGLLRRALLSGSAALSVVGTAFAEEKSEGEDARIALADIEDQISVYATRSPAPAFDYPGQVSVVGKDVIDDYVAQSVSDIFDAIPGARFDGGPRRSGETPSVRGVEGEGVLVLFDGVRQSFLSGHDGRFFIDPSLLQAVEVVRGPTSALYGSGALGGVIALRTIDAADLLNEDETAAVRAATGFQSVNDQWRIGLTGAWRSDDGATDLIGNFTLRDSGDIRLGDGILLPADDEIVSSLIKGTAQLSESVSASASWIRYSGNSVDPNNPQGANLGGPGNGFVARDIGSDTFRAGLNVAPPGSNAVNLNVIGYYVRNKVEEDEVDSTRIVSRAIETFGVTADNRSRVSLSERADVVLTYGAEFYEDQQRGRDNTSPDGSRGGVPDATARFYGVFAQAELTLERPLGAPGVFSLIPGARWDRFETQAPGEADTENSAWSPKVGVSWKPVPELLFFGNWAKAFRAPSFNEIYADGPHFVIPDFSGPPGPPTFVSNLFVANPDLVAEESKTWEAGAGVDLSGVAFGDDRFTAKASYFRSDVTNLIDLEVMIPAGCFGAPFPPCGSGAAFGNFSRNVNVTNAEIDGVEVEAQYESEWFYVRANFSTIDGRNTDTGAFVGVLSPNRFFVDAGVKFPSTDLRAGSRVTVAGDFTEVNDPLLVREGFTAADVYLVWRPSSGPLEGLRVDLGVDNLTDADFEVVAAGVSQPGRNLKVALTWEGGFR